METPTENTLEKVDLSEHEAPGTQTLPISDIISQFDEILGKNLDRLLGIRQGIEALPLNIFTVSCLILLATRETEIEGFPYLPPERYTNGSLLNDMSDMNIEHGGDLEAYISAMGKKEYIKVENDGRLFPGSPIMKMAVLFDRIFPKMPGLNLVAYLGQMIDEVLSNRKSLKTALNQFDQMLSIQGVSLIRDADSTHKDTAKSFPHLKVLETAQLIKKKIIPVDIKPSDIYSKLQTKAWTPPQHKAEMPISSFEPEQDGAGRETPADVPGPRDAGADLIKEIKQHRQEDMRTPAGQEDAEYQISVSHDQHDSNVHAGYTPSIDGSVPVRGYDQDFDWEPEDDDIEKKIAAFVEELSMKCPLCRVSGIVPQTTARGKSYYKCSNDECNFISWGKPFYLPCPKCENPFLIETPDSQGNLILKCPKTTCLHWQKFPWDEDDEKDIKSLEQEPSAVTAKKPRRLVRRRKRVVVRRKS
jgi:hypothetical protein